MLKAFTRAEVLAELAARAVNDVDYLVSGDTGEESFIQASLVWAPDHVADLLAGRASLSQADEALRRRNDVWRLINVWAQNRWDPATQSRAEAPDAATSARWSCADRVAARLDVRGQEGLERIRPLDEVLAALADLADDWPDSGNPTIAACGRQLRCALAGS